MNRETAVWLLLLALGAGGLAWRAFTAPQGVGIVYVAAQQPPAGAAADSAQTVRYQEVGRDAPNARFSPLRTIGLWVAALLTLGAMSYLYRDNPCYKLVEAIVVGVSAGYWFNVGFWDNLVAKLFLKLTPSLITSWAAPLAEGEPSPAAEWWYLAPLALGVMLFFRFVPKLEWVAVWPLAFVVGMTAGLKLIVFLEADFLTQIRNTCVPLVVFVTEQPGGPINWAATFNQSLKNTLLVLGVLASLTYFYFSVQHVGVVRHVARFGIWVLMISFGSSFAFTVMGRITLLTVRLEFLLGRWLGLIDVPR
ncbi:MAG: hypothetical protein U0872_06900 [Planctomycetaceae bacterium]